MEWMCDWVLNAYFSPIWSLLLSFDFFDYIAVSLVSRIKLSPDSLRIRENPGNVNLQLLVRGPKRSE